MPLDPAYRAKLIHWGVTVLLSLLSAVAAKYGLPAGELPPPPAAVTAQ